MEIKEKYNLWQNTVAVEYNKNTRLVMNSLSQRLMIQKNVSKDSLEIYNNLIKCEHPNLARIYDTSQSIEGGIILEQFIDGVTLEYYLQHSVSTPLDKESIILQICDGLMALHEKNIIHRDMTPSNIIITDDGTVKIIDFDIARTPKRNARRDTVLLGTEGFAAPEQFGFYQSTSRTDIYALGIIINYIYTGDLPSVKPYKENGRLRRIINKCTEINPDQRFSNVSEVKNELLTAFGRECKKGDQKKGFAGVIDLMLADLPGFRTRSRIPKPIAAALYFMAIMFIIGAYITYGQTPIQLLLCTTMLILCLVIPFFCFSDYLSLQKGMFRQLSPISHRRLFKAVGFLSIFAGLIQLGAIPRF